MKTPIIYSLSYQTLLLVYTMIPLMTTIHPANLFLYYRYSIDFFNSHNFGYKNQRWNIHKTDMPPLTKASLFNSIVSVCSTGQVVNHFF